VYSPEEGTPAYSMSDQVPTSVKKKRLDALMKLQQDISKTAHQRFVGKNLKVLIDEQEAGKDNVYLGRSEYDAPEVDGVVYVQSSQKLNPGDFAQVRITDAYEYDLQGELA